MNSCSKKERSAATCILLKKAHYGDIIISMGKRSLSILLLTVRLWNADLTKSEKGFYAMSFVLSMFAAIAVQKNTRDTNAAKKNQPNDHHKEPNP